MTLFILLRCSSELKPFLSRRNTYNLKPWFLNLKTLMFAATLNIFFHFLHRSLQFLIEQHRIQ